MVTVITACIYRPSISKELKVLYRHIIFWGLEGERKREKRGEGWGREERGREEEGKEGGRKGEREQRAGRRKRKTRSAICTALRWQGVRTRCPRCRGNQ